MIGTQTISSEPPALRAVAPTPRRAPALTSPVRAGKARSWGVVVSIAVHVVVLLIAGANLGRARPHPVEQEPEPIRVRLPRLAAATPPAPARQDPPVRKPISRPPTPRPTVTPPPPEPAPPEPAPPEEAPPADSPAEATGPADGESREVVAEAPGPAGGVPGGTDDPLELAAVARPPRLLARVTPEYPRAARSDRIEGLVVLRAVIARDGTVERDQIRVVRSVPALDAAAIAALAAWRFTPAIDHTGRAVRVVVEIPFEFALR